ncbi:uncharacterized protein LOC110831904 isoform X2 [Zootermopsis nevadensis]|uniref:uncharacterized protein LOC110831904 isoform X2 n=1 Tax=Zootermopsis nevadensis TaxID=136037 RepID=UPI000B8E9854|nr:uncharacterized protein LOC110831904 isoform X2 [Zootermopsis nevadensis]
MLPVIICVVLLTPALTDCAPDNLALRAAAYIKSPIPLDSSRFFDSAPQQRRYGRSFGSEPFRRDYATNLYSEPVPAGFSGSFHSAPAILRYIWSYGPVPEGSGDFPAYNYGASDGKAY